MQYRQKAQRNPSVVESCPQPNEPLWNKSLKGLDTQHNQPVQLAKRLTHISLWGQQPAVKSNEMLLAPVEAGDTGRCGLFFRCSSPDTEKEL